MRRPSLLVRFAALALLTYPVAAATAASPTPPGKQPPSNHSAPAISGTATVGTTLTASPGAWSGGGGTTYTFQWLRCDSAGAGCTSLANENGTTHLVAAAEAGFTLRVRVRATNKNGAAEATSAQTSVITSAGSAPPPPPTATPPPTSTTPTTTTTTTTTTPAPPPSSPPAAYGDRVGFASHTAYLSEADGAAFMQRSASIGVRWLREDFAWSWIEGRGKGQFDWTVPDRVMRNASKVGANVLAMVGYSPSWANGGRADDKYPPLNPRDYADFAVAVAKRYGANGTFWAANPTLTPRPVAAIEIWNEPWLWSFWKPEPNVAAYAAMVRAAAPAIKAAQPSMKVLVSGDLQLGYADGRDYSNGTGRNWEYGFLAQLLKQDFASGSVDAYSVHPYCQNFDPYQTAIPWFGDQTFAQQWLYQKLVLTRDMVTAAGRFKPLWTTEFGWSTKGDVDEATQAKYVRGALKRAVEEWGSFIERSFIFVLARPDNSHYAGAYNLFRDDMTSKPAWSAVQTLIATGS